MNLLTKVKLAKLAYEPEMSKIGLTLRAMFGISKKDIKFIYVKKTDTEGVIFRYNDDCYCCFSGTESITDLWQDLMFFPMRYVGETLQSGFSGTGSIKDLTRLPRQYMGGWLHSGFNKIFRLLTDDVIKTVKELFKDKEPDNIYSLGHSLGGSISCGVADIIKIFLYPDINSEITTWGCPNGWSKAARKGFESRHQVIENYINSWDIVTKLLCLTTGRPGTDVKLKGEHGHSLFGYIQNIKDL